MPQDVEIPDVKFVPGIHPGLREWLRVRREAREIKEQKGSGKVTSALAVRYKYKEHWQSEALKLPNQSLDNYSQSTERCNVPEVAFALMLRSQGEFLNSDMIADYFMRYRGLKLIQLAYEYGFNMNYKCRLTGKSLLHWAIEHSDEEKIIFLLDHSAQVNGRDSKGNTPLHIALQPITTFHPVTIVEDLIASGADIEARDCHGRTPLHLACAYKNQSYAELLLTNKADILVEDNEGKLPYDYCVNKEQFRRWFDQKCFWLMPRVVYQELRAKLLARTVVKDMFNVVQPRCKVCKRKLGDCHNLKMEKYRYWVMVHGRMDGEKAAL